ncbi:MAG: hypothetical protein ACAH27_17005 [Xanthobacteraceae bacterium]
MYDPVFTDPPRDEAHFWELVEENFDHALQALSVHPVETKEDAISGRYRFVGDDGKLYLPGLSVIVYRGDSAEMDQRDHYLELGRELLPVVRNMIDDRKLTQEFTHLWSVLQFCHGFIASYLFCDSDSMASARGGAGKKRQGQRKWIATLISRLQAKDMTRNEIDELLGKFIKAHITKLRNNKVWPRGFDEK